MTETKWLRLLAIIPSSMMLFMDQSILPVALPVIKNEFGASDASSQWSVNAYLLAWTVFVIIGGKVGDRIGHRTSYLWGMIFFALFSALCGISPNVGFLVVARALQGVAGAFMGPSQTALIASCFPAHARGRATGIIVSMGSIFLVLGPMVGGFLTDFLSWRWIFWINLPIALIGIFLILSLLPKIDGKEEKIDLWGFLFFAGFAMFSTLFFMQGANWGWSSLQIILAAVVAIVALLFLFIREKKTTHPFLEIHLFKRPLFTSINISISISQFVLMITVFRTIYTETILGYSPTEAGLITSVSCLPVLFFSYIGGFLSDKASPKVPIALGYLCIIFSFFWLGLMPTPSLAFYFPPLLLFGIGLPLIFTPSYSMAMSDLPKEKLGIGFAMVSMLRMYAGTMGLALIFAFTQYKQNTYAPKVGGRIAEIISFSSVHYALGILMIFAFIAAIIFHRRKSAHHLPDAPADGWD
ncbi:MAG: MFS transporter [Parachlamydiales bacterium]|nr:MFS transporter [Parachlamydiales bacterium]